MKTRTTFNASSPLRRPLYSAVKHVPNPGRRLGTHWQPVAGHSVIPNASEDTPRRSEAGAIARYHEVSHGLVASAQWCELNSPQETSLPPSQNDALCLSLAEIFRYQIQLKAHLVSSGSSPVLRSNPLSRRTI